MLIRVVLSAILIASVSSANSRGTILTGGVSDGSVPVAGAIVTVSNRYFVTSATTDESGRFILEAPRPGRFDFRVSAPGFAVVERSVTVHAGSSLRNRTGITELVPVDQQTVSIMDLMRSRTPKVVSHDDRGQVGQQSLR